MDSDETVFRDEVEENAVVTDAMRVLERAGFKTLRWRSEWVACQQAEGGIDALAIV